MLQYIEKDMMDIAGLHDVSQGMAPAGTPAEAVQLLQRADNTQHSYVRADIEISAAKIKEWEIALVEQFGVAPFIGNVQEGNPYDSIEQGVITFEHIRNGGQYRIVYVPGSSMEDSPDQKLQKVLTMRQMGLFGDPGDPSTNKLVVSMLNIPETSKIIQHLNEQEEGMAQQAMMAQQMAMQQQSVAERSATKFDPEEAQMQSQLEIQKIQAQVAAKTDADLIKMRERSRLTQENDAAKGIVDISTEKIKRQTMPTANQ
jgi:hypothetical protein